jgi:chromosome segregation ATPase
VAAIQKTVKGDLNSFEGELSEQRRILYLELGVLKEGQSSVRNILLSLERGQGLDSSTLDGKVTELESEVRVLKNAMKDSIDNVGSDVPSNLTKEVITALVTEVILADTVDRRSRDLAAAAETIAEKQITHITSLSEESECRVAVQLQAMRGEFKNAEELLMKRVTMRDAEIAESKKTSCIEVEEWKSEMHKKMEDFQVKFSKSSEVQTATIKQLRDDLDKKSEQLAQLVGAIQLKNEQAVSAAASALMEARTADKKQAEPTAAAVSLLQKDVAKMTSKVDEVQTALAKMSVQSMHVQEEVKTNTSDVKETRSQITQLTTTISDIQKSVTKTSTSSSSTVVAPVVSTEQLSRLEDRIEALSSATAAKRETDSSTENRVQTVATQHAKLAGELDALRAAFSKAEKEHTQSTSQGSSALKR